MFELCPPALHELGLESALRSLTKHIGARYEVCIAFEDDGESKPLDESTRNVLFRSARELLINAAKHARARRICVRLERAEDTLRIAVEDDGVGMDPEIGRQRPDAQARSGFGLFSLRERLDHVGARMTIDSVPSHGTTIVLEAPLCDAHASTLQTRATA
jgi:signal transduction histidine kinase